MNERLGKPKLTYRENMFYTGKLAGESWAHDWMECKEYGNLLGVLQLVEKTEKAMLDRVSDYCASCDFKITPSEFFCLQAWPDKHVDPEFFWGEIIETDKATRNYPAFIDGFLAGVVETSNNEP